MCCTRRTWTFPSRGRPGSPSGCSRCRSRCTSCRSGFSSRTLSPAPTRRHSAPGRRASSARCRGTPWPSPDGTPAPRRSTAPGIRSSRCTPCPDAPWLPPRPQGASPQGTRPVPFPSSRCVSFPPAIGPKRRSASGGLSEIFAGVLSVLDLVLAADLVAHDDPVVLELVQREIVVDDDGDQFARLGVFQGGLCRFRIGAGDLDLHDVAHHLQILRHGDAGGEKKHENRHCRCNLDLQYLSHRSLLSDPDNRFP